MKSTTVVTPERMDSTQPCIAAAWASWAVRCTALGPVMQVNHFFSTMSSPSPLSRVWNRWVWVFTIPGITMRPLQSTISAPGYCCCSCWRLPTAAMRSFCTQTLAALQDFAAIVHGDQPAIGEDETHSAQPPKTLCFVHRNRYPGFLVDLGETSFVVLATKTEMTVPIMLTWTQLN